MVSNYQPILILSFRFFVSKYSHKKIITLFSWLIVGLGLNSIAIGIREILIDYHNIDAFFTLLLGFQVIFFAYIIGIERKQLNNHHFCDYTKREEKLTNFNAARIAIIIPTHNEERLIIKTISGIPLIVDEIYVINDGSTDQTRFLVEEYSKTVDQRVTLITHAKNKGVGAAIITGYKRAFQDNHDIFVVIGADAQMDMNDLPRLIEPILNREADYIKGNRLLHQDVLAYLRLFL